MRGLGGITSAISQLLEALGITLPPWVAPVVVLGLALLLLPLILRNMRTGRARKLMKRAAMSPGPEGAAMERQALELVGRHPMGLVAIAEEALRRGRTALATDAVDRLVETGKQRHHARRLFRQLQDEMPASIEEMVLVIERFIDAGLFGEATRRLERARERWPDSAELDNLEERIPSFGE